MATPRPPNQKKQYPKLYTRLAKYGKLVELIYDRFNREAAALALRTDYDPAKGVLFRFSDFPQTRKAIEVLLDRYGDDIAGMIDRTTSEEWQKSNEVQDLLANKVLTAYNVTDKDGREWTRYYQNNSDQLKAFQRRKEAGTGLSKRVWNLKQQYREDLELGLSVGIERGGECGVARHQAEAVSQRSRQAVP